METTNLSLADLNTDEPARIVSLTEDSEVSDRMQSIGFIEGARVCVKHIGPINRDPIVVEVRGTLIGLRHQEAATLIVKKENH